MVAHPPLGLDAPLPELWRAWTRILGLFAKRARSRFRPTPGEYETLHRTLLAMCDTQAAAGTPESDYYRQLGEVVRPWVTLHSLQMIDGELLSELYTRCQRIDCELHGGRAMREDLAHWVTPSTVVVALVVGLVGVGVYTGVFGWLGDKLNEWGFVIRVWWVRRSTAELILMGAAVVVSVGWWLLSRTRRS